MRGGWCSYVHPEEQRKGALCLCGVEWPYVLLSGMWVLSLFLLGQRQLECRAVGGTGGKEVREGGGGGGGGEEVPVEEERRWWGRRRRGGGEEGEVVVGEEEELEEEELEEEEVEKEVE